MDAALQAVLSGHRLVGMLFHRNGSHFDPLEFGEEAQALLSDRAYCTVMLSSATVSTAWRCQWPRRAAASESRCIVWEL